MEKTTQQIRRELKLLILKMKKDCATEQQENKAVNDARHLINLKYGDGWREKDILKSENKMSAPYFYEGHTHGQHWMD